MNKKMVKSHFLNKCGNSSVVERDLAMVDVASSTLVSRSIFLLLFFISNLFSLTLSDIVNVKIQNIYPSIQIENLEIIQPKNLPSNFNEFNLQDLEISRISGDGGILKASYKTPNSQNKTLFIDFNLQAKIPIFTAKIDIAKDHVINPNDYEIKIIDFKDFKKDSLTQIDHTLITKIAIKKNQILKSRQFKNKFAILKNDKITLIVKDGGLSVESFGIANQAGNIGDLIEVRYNSKLLRAKIISKNKAIIR